MTATGQETTEASMTTTSQNRMFQLYSAQTGMLFGKVLAASEGDALDKFAQSRGWTNRAAMWAAGSCEYLSAYAGES